MQKNQSNIIYQEKCLNFNIYFFSFADPQIQERAEGGYLVYHSILLFLCFKLHSLHYYVLSRYGIRDGAITVVHQINHPGEVIIISLMCVF